MSAPGFLTRLGFDGPRLAFTFRTAIASALALAVAALLHIDNPQWAAMTVWVVAQPTRGQLLEKGAFRIIGTLTGALVGVGLILGCADTPTLLVVGLAAWIGLCAGAGNLIGGFTGYGTILAGYSAAMVALVDFSHPDHIYGLALDRVLTICVGVAVSFAVGWLFTPASAESDLFGRARRLTARVLRHLAQGLDTADMSPFFTEERAIISEMAAIDDALDPHAAGSARSRRVVRHIRTLMAALLGALVLARGRAGTSPTPLQREEGIAALRAAADALDASTPDTVPLAHLPPRLARDRDDTGLAQVAETLARAYQTLQAPQLPALEEDADDLPQLLLHRDVVGARAATLRAAGAVLVVGALWLATGWTYGPFMLMGAAIMTSLFSTFDNPALTMRFVLGGSVAGGLAALAARWLVLPHAGDLVQVIALTVPFILIGALVMAHRRTMLAGMDYNMSLLLLLQPAFPLHGTVVGMAQMVFAMLLGPLIAMLAFRLAFPMDARRRRAMLVGMMVNELKAMARAPLDAAAVARWRARLYHRLLRLVRWTEKSGDRDFAAVDGGLAALALGTAIRTLHAASREPDVPDSLARALHAALASFRLLPQDPGRVADALERAASRLARNGRDGADTLRRADAALRANAGFFLDPNAAAARALMRRAPA
ncbi:FUSC family protein [Xanthobacter variabilis]|uniref:FUSC family protein n=1 Tax=Xanthobacter variabilis TaxID=3119932 RepID=UPI00374F48CB